MVQIVGNPVHESVTFIFWGSTHLSVARAVLLRRPACLSGGPGPRGLVALAGPKRIPSSLALGPQRRRSGTGGNGGM